MEIQQPPDIASDKRSLFIAFIIALSFSLLLWILKLVESLGGFDFTQLGIYPRRFDGLIGVFLAPLIHGSAAHLFANTPPLLVLGTLLIYGYPQAAKVLFPVVYIGSSLLVWIFAREAYHIGASGLAFGMLSFVFTIGIFRWEPRTIAISLIVFFLYGSMITGIIPGESNISFESHLSGALIGLVLAILLRHRDPVPPPKQYSWENEETNTDNSD